MMTDKERLEAMTRAVAAGDMFSNFRGLVERGETEALANKIVNLAEALIKEVNARKPGKAKAETES